MPRSRIVAGLLAVLVLVGAFLLSTAKGGSAFADPATGADGARTLAVGEADNLPATGASLSVTGSGFDPSIDVYLAVCSADTKPGDDLVNCVGGQVPGSNTGKAWAVLTDVTAGKANATKFGEGGAFSLKLTVDAATGSSVDCVAKGCVLIARSVGEEASRPADITVGLQFVAPTSSSTSSSSSTASVSSSSSTSTSEAPATVGPDTIAMPEARAGDQQAVVFTGFIAGENVAVTVFSEPVDLPPVKASAGGVVAITFAISDALVPGQHTVQAVGEQSRLVGLASFTVLAAVPTTPSTVESSTVSSTTTPTTSSAPVTTSTETTSTSATTTSGAALPAAPSSGRNLWWLWVLLILLVVVGGIIAAVTVSRRKAQQLEQDRLDREQQLAEAAAATPAPTVFPPDQPWQASGYNDPSQSHGLLSGHEGDGPALYSGQGGYPPAGPPTPPPAPPTVRIEPPTQRIGTPPPRVPRPPLADPDPEPPTTAFRAPGASGSTPPAPESTPSSTEPPSPASEPPNTQRWSPFGDEDDDTEDPPRRR